MRLFVSSKNGVGGTRRLNCNVLHAVRLWFVLILMSTTAAAEPFDRKDKETFRAVDDGIALAIGRPGALYVVKGKQFTRLAPADTFDKLTIDKSAKKVIADIADYTCAGKSHYEWTFGHLTARIENAVA